MDRRPLVGRDDELSQLSAAMVAKRGAVITGAAGSGKTTLAMTGLRVAERRGMSVARAAATWASRELPFGALAPILPPDPSGDVVAREDRGGLLRRYSRAVAGRAGGSRWWCSLMTRTCWTGVRDAGASAGLDPGGDGAGHRALG
jgi:hypothetical protein